MAIANGERRARRPVVIVCLGAYWPNNEASGPIQSFKAMAAALGEEFEFRLIARDRPFGAKSSTPIVRHGEWSDLGFAKAHYAVVGWCGAARLADILGETPHDVLWLNGFFDREFTIPALFRRRRFGPAGRVIVSPRGEFFKGALSLKAQRKKLYLELAKRLRLLEGVWFHATSEDERADICRLLPGAHVIVAPNVRQLGPVPPTDRRVSESLRLVFLGRISRVKNLHFAIDALADVRSRVNFDVYGPLEDPQYWQECEKRAGRLPSHVVVARKGNVANEAVPAVLANCDLLFLPSLSENFGHAIFEALSCGVPVLIGDQTPWRALDRDQAGWDLPLDDPRRFARVIDAFAAMPATERERWRRGARSRAERWVSESDAVERTRQMLWTVMGQRAPAAFPDPAVGAI